jgi:hypothetical protein
MKKQTLILMAATSLIIGLCEAQQPQPTARSGAVTRRVPFPDPNQSVRAWKEKHPNSIIINVEGSPMIVTDRGNLIGQCVFVDLCPRHYSGPSSFVLEPMNTIILNPTWTPVAAINRNKPSEARISDGVINGIAYYNQNLNSDVRKCFWQVFRVPVEAAWPGINAPINIAVPRWPLWQDGNEGRRLQQADPNYWKDPKNHSKRWFH